MKIGFTQETIELDIYMTLHWSGRTTVLRAEYTLITDIADIATLT